MSDVSTIISPANSPKAMMSVDNLTLAHRDGSQMDGLFQPWNGQWVQFLAISPDAVVEMVFKPDNLSLFDNWSWFSATLFRCVPIFYAHAPLKSITIRFEYSSVTYQDWRTLLTHYSSTIENIIIDFDYGGAPIDEGIVISFLEVLQTSENETGSVVCPNLRTLRLMDVVAGDTYAGALTNCVRSRAERGYKLRQLSFNKPSNWYRREDRWEYPDLTEFVEKVDYREG